MSSSNALSTSLQFSKVASLFGTKGPNIKFWLFGSGETLNSHKDFIAHLKKQVPLQEVYTVDECDFILGFCPIVSRAVTDIEAAMKKLHNIPDTKPVVLVVLQHTFDGERVVPDSSRSVNRENMIVVDCLFYEDTGLLQCQKNKESLSKTLQYLEKKLHMKLKGQVAELGNSAKSNEAIDEGIKDTDMKPEKMVLSNEAQESKNTPHERNQQLNQEEILKKIEKRLETQKILVNEHEQDLKDLQACFNKQLQEMMIVVEQQKTELAENNKELEEKESLLTERETQLTERDKQLQEKDRLLTENTQKLQMKDKALEEKEKHLREIENDLGIKQTWVNEKVRQQESGLMEKDKEIQKNDKPLGESAQKTQRKDETLEQKGTRFKQEKEREENANLGECERFNRSTNQSINQYSQVESKSQENKHQQKEIKTQQEKDNTDEKNDENLTQEKGAISKATNRELEKHNPSYEGPEPLDLKEMQTQESQPQVEERENKNEEEKNEELNEHEKVQDAQTKENETVGVLSDADGMLMETEEQAYNNKHGNENQQPDAQESNLGETQEVESDEQHEETNRPQLGNTFRENNQGSIEDTDGEERE